MISNFPRFRDAISSYGLTPPDVIFPDGRIHRFGRKKSCWYLAFSEPVMTIVFGDWRQGITEKFIDIDRPITRLANRRIGERIKQAVRISQQDIDLKQVRAAANCNDAWKRSKPAIRHPYLERKKVSEYRLRILDEWLLIPVTDGNRIHSLQRINGDGAKRFYPDGRVQGFFYPIGMDGNPTEFYICEGIATGLTIYQLQKAPVIVAFNAKNLIPVAELMRWRYSDATIVIAGDNDHSTPGNPGKTAAELAAVSSTSGGNSTKWAVPDFTGLPFTEKDTDFNDLAILRGDL